MKGYIYTMYKGADPGAGWKMSDPDIYSATPSLGACVPNVRRAVNEGDYIFIVSGRIASMRQFVVGGFQVAEKIDALSAFDRFPEKRLKRDDETGQILGNIIVDKYGNHSGLDDHKNFDRRVENYIVGRNPEAFKDALEIEVARDQSLGMLKKVFHVENANKMHDVIARWRKLDKEQVEVILAWIRKIKGG
ncbi:hypothetical protein [Alcanivorax xiamenensis]|uniref:hypothetical protein n=1 Tax=Alcanivorax xiamenensis TaxID=1177156 RepID=UPI001359EC7C|nr:hypothetical protein [Alcanivorax xiamenensis]